MAGPRARRAARFDAFQRRHPVLGFPIAVTYKFFDDQGNYLAALIAYYGFLSLFPLLLLLTAILGLVLRGNSHLRHEVLTSTLGQFPIIRDDLVDPSKLGGSTIGILAGILVSLYGGMGIANALQNSMNVAWGIPRNERPNPIRLRVRSLKLLAFGGLAVISTTVLSGLGSNADSFGANIGAGLAGALTGASVAVNAAIFILVFKYGTDHPLRIRDVALGALFAASAWQALQFFGTAIVGSQIKNASATNSVFALVLGLIAFIYVAAIAVVVGIELNVVRLKRLYPRALLTPFSDDVELTSADVSAYTLYAKAQRHKGFERINVGFDEDET